MDTQLKQIEVGKNVWLIAEQDYGKAEEWVARNPDRLQRFFITFPASLPEIVDHDFFKW